MEKSEQQYTHNMGTFLGFNLREDKAIKPNLTVGEVIAWNHGRDGEAKFWPIGDHFGVATLLCGRAPVNVADLIDLDRLLTELGDDSEDTYLRIHFACSELGISLSKLTGLELQELNLQVFKGSTFFELRKEVAYELFETYFPEHFKFWEQDKPGILTFDWERFLNGPLWNVLEVDWGRRKALLVAPA